MHDPWNLPTKLEISGKQYSIRTDFRAVIDILRAQADTDLTNQEKMQVLFEILFINPERIPQKCMEEACKKAIEFIDCGIKDDGRKRPRMMDWEQDSAVIIPAVNKVLGKEIRSMPYCHWWTFLGAYMEIGDGVYQQILQIRQKKLKGKKLEKWEKEFYAANKNMIDLKSEIPERPADEKEEIRNLFGYGK